MSTTHKYIILFGKFGRLEKIDGVDTLVVKKPGDIVDLTLEAAAAKQASVRLATQPEIDLYEARLRGEVQEPPTIPLTHQSTAGAPPAPTPPVDPYQPDAVDVPPARHFPEPADRAHVTPVVPAATPVATPSTQQAVADSQTASDRQQPSPPQPSQTQPMQKPAPQIPGVKDEGKPKARTGAKTGGTKKSSKGRK